MLTVPASFQYIRQTFRNQFLHVVFHDIPYRIHPVSLKNIIRNNCNKDNIHFTVSFTNEICRLHSVHAFHFYVQKNNVMLLTVREVRIGRGIFCDTAFPALLFDERNEVRPYIFFIITHRNFYRFCHLQSSTNLSEKSRRFLTSTS